MEAGAFLWVGSRGMGWGLEKAKSCFHLLIPAQKERIPAGVTGSKALWFQEQSPLPTPIPQGCPSEEASTWWVGLGKSKPVQVHFHADFLPGTPRWGADSAARGHAQPGQMPHPQLLEGRESPGGWAASSLDLPPLGRPA